jgi:hypothetical protein
MTSPVIAALASAKAAEAAAKELKRLGLPGPPRGWDGAAKAAWFMLPDQLKLYTTKRENDRDRALKKALNQVAALRAALQKEKHSEQEQPTAAASPDRAADTTAESATAH